MFIPADLILSRSNFLSYINMYVYLRGVWKFMRTFYEYIIYVTHLNHIWNYTIIFIYYIFENFYSGMKLFKYSFELSRTLWSKGEYSMLV